MKKCFNSIPMNKSSSFLDRIGYGGVMLFFGTIVGCIAGIAGLGLSKPPHFNVAALLFTLIVFFVIGFVFLDRGSDFVAVCFVSLLLIFSIASETVLHEPRREDFSPTWCLLALVAWLAAITYILFNF
jgi:hypothetical protein